MCNTYNFGLFITLIVEIHLIMVFYGWLSSLTCDYVIADDKSGLA